MGEAAPEMAPDVGVDAAANDTPEVHSGELYKELMMELDRLDPEDGEGAAALAERATKLTESSDKNVAQAANDFLDRWEKLASGEKVEPIKAKSPERAKKNADEAFMDLLEQLKAASTPKEEDALYDTVIELKASRDSELSKAAAKFLKMWDAAEARKAKGADASINELLQAEIKQAAGQEEEISSILEVADKEEVSEGMEVFNTLLDQLRSVDTPEQEDSFHDQLVELKASQNPDISKAAARVLDVWNNTASAEASVTEKARFDALKAEVAKVAGVDNKDDAVETKAEAKPKAETAAKTESAEPVFEEVDERFEEVGTRLEAVKARFAEDDGLIKGNPELMPLMNIDVGTFTRIQDKIDAHKQGGWWARTLGKNRKDYKLQKEAMNKWNELLDKAEGLVGVSDTVRAEAPLKTSEQVTTAPITIGGTKMEAKQPSRTSETARTPETSETTPAALDVMVAMPADIRSDIMAAIKEGRAIELTDSDPRFLAIENALTGKTLYDMKTRDGKEFGEPITVTR